MAGSGGGGGNFPQWPVFSGLRAGFLPRRRGERFVGGGYRRTEGLSKLLP